MSIEKGRAYFRALGMEERVIEFTVSSATVDLAAQALGVDGARIAKTLSFKTADGCMLILAAGDARIDNHKFKDKFHMKAKMLSADEVLELVNPEIVSTEGENTVIEGCLSVPGRAGRVVRPEKVTVKAQDRDGNAIEVTGEGMLAVCLCHELDHLDGILYVDKMIEDATEEMKRRRGGGEA